MKAVRIVVVDDHRLVLEALERILEADDGFNVVGTTNFGAEVLGIVERTRPDMVLMDVHMPDMSGLDVLDGLKRHHADVQVVFISAGADSGEIRSALQRGAAGYLVKSINPNDVPGALRQIRDGTAYMNVEGEDGDAAPSAPGSALAVRAGLTPKEIDILKAVCRGLTNREIAKEMWVTEQTVKFHLSNLYRKLDVQNRGAAIRLGLTEGLDPGERA
jgi:DNA-binding NarL/FixJ family response regulator